MTPPTLPKRLLPALALALLVVLPGCSQSAPQAPDKAIFIPQEAETTAPTPTPLTTPQDTEP